MSNFTNPLDKIKIASPCAANWDEMHGDARKRFCSECKLNVYNLSEMTKTEAENLLINSEGRLCVRFYRRADGTVLTQNCPVGWAKVKQRVAKLATAAFSMIIGFFGGFAGFSQLTNINQDLFEKVAVEDETDKNRDKRKTEILIETNELTDEVSVELPVSVGRIDTSAFTYVKKRHRR